MKKAYVALLFCLSQICSSHCFSLSREFISVQKLLDTGQLGSRIKSLGGHSGRCIEWELQNNNSDSLYVWIEAGRKLDSDNPGEQDILVVRHERVALGPRESTKVAVEGVCCQATNSSPETESSYSPGKMAPDVWVLIANYISASDFPSEVVQHTIWVLSDEHDIRSIPAIQGFSTQALREKVAEVLDIDLPWYSFDYSDDSLELFSGERSHIFAEIPYEIPFHAIIGGVIYDATGKIVYQSPMYNARTGKNVFVLNASIAGWPNGRYTFEILEDLHTVNQYRAFSLDDNG